MRYRIPCALIFSCMVAVNLATPVNVSFASEAAILAAFDLEFDFVSTGHYRCDGGALTYDELIALVNAQNARSVVVRDASGVGDLVCIAAIAKMTRADVYYIDKDGNPKILQRAGSRKEANARQPECAGD